MPLRERRVLVLVLYRLCESYTLTTKRSTEKKQRKKKTTDSRYSEYFDKGRVLLIMLMSYLIAVRSIIPLSLPPTGGDPVWPPVWGHTPAV